MKREPSTLNVDVDDIQFNNRMTKAPGRSRNVSAQNVSRSGERRYSESRPQQERRYSENRPQQERRYSESRPQQERSNYDNQKTPSQMRREDSQYYKKSLNNNSYGPSDGDSERREKGKKKKKGHKVLKTILVLLLVIVVALAAIWLVVPGGKNFLIKTALQSPLGGPLAQIYLGDNYKNIYNSDYDRSAVLTNQGASTGSGYYTFALIGIDTRDVESLSGSRSDTMLVVSVSNSGEIKMASVSRDTYLYISDNTGYETYNKANAAYAFLGPIGTVNMLNQNFDLDIQDYITVNFSGLTKIVDEMGGIDIQVTDTELPYLNKYVRDLNGETGTSYEELPASGYVHVTGAQATAFCRIRYCDFISPLDGQTYNSDWGRTARQRYVLTVMLSQLKSSGISNMMDVCKEIVSENGTGEKFIETSMEIGKFANLLGKCFDVNLQGTQNFPLTDYLYTQSMSVGDSIIANTLEENASFMHEFLYGTEGYVPSAALSEIATKIRYQTG